MKLQFSFIVVMIEMPRCEDVGTICSHELSVRESDFTFGFCNLVEIGFLKRATSNTLTVRRN